MSHSERSRIGEESGSKDCAVHSSQVDESFRESFRKMSSALGTAYVIACVGWRLKIARRASKGLAPPAKASANPARCPPACLFRAITRLCLGCLDIFSILKLPSGS